MIGARLRAGAGLAGALFAVACGSDFRPSGGLPPRAGTDVPAATLAAVYDLLAELPDARLPGTTADGVEVDATLELVEADGDRLEGTLRIRSVAIGGTVEPHTPLDGLPVVAHRTGDRLEVDPVGPIRVGPASFHLAYSATIGDDGRTLSGTSELPFLPASGDLDGVRQRRYLVAATDFLGGSGRVMVVRIRYDDVVESSSPLDSLSSDPVMRSCGDQPCVLNRLGFDNLQLLEPHGEFRTRAQHSTGNGSNPHDVVVVAPGEAYVTRYEPPYDDVLKLDLDTGATLGSIDLAGEASEGFFPRADRMTQVDDHLYVALQNVDGRFSAWGPAALAVIDPVADAVVDRIDLVGVNPVSAFGYAADLGRLYIASAGLFFSGELSGGVEAVDLATRTSLGLVADDDALGGHVSALALTEGDLAFAIVTEPSSFANRLVAFDRLTGELRGTVYTSGGFLPDVAADGDGLVVLADQDPDEPALRFFDAATGTLRPELTQPLPIPPFSVLVLTRTL